MSRPGWLANLTKHDTFVDGLPHATFAWLRSHEPVAWIDEPGGSGFWAITRHDDIRAVGQDWETFTSTRGIRLEDMSPDELDARRTLMEHDPPEHTRLRRIVQGAFTRKAVERREPEIRALARSVVDEALERQSLDFVTDVAKRLPIGMLCRLLGIPDSDADHLVRLADEMISNTDPEFARLVVDRDDTDAYRLLPFRSPAAAEVFDYAATIAEDRRQSPRDDIITLLVTAEPDGRPLTDLEFKNFFALLLAAGNETTRHAIAHGFLAFAEHPAQRHAWVDNPGARATGTEEILRWASVTIHFRRTATRDIVLRGTPIAKGDKVVMWYASGNRDPDAFTDPFTFDLLRDPNPHLAFGYGPHMCVGAWLARMELRALFDELLPRVAGIEVTAPPRRLRSNFHHGINHLQARLSPV